MIFTSGENRAACFSNGLKTKSFQANILFEIDAKRLANYINFQTHKSAPTKFPI